MMYWHKFQMIFCVDRLELLRHQYVSGHVSGVDTAVLLAYQEETKQPRHPIAGLPLLEFSPVLSTVIYTGPTSCLKPSFPHTFSSFVFFQPSLSFCRSARLMSSALSALSSTSWVDTPFSPDWLQVCFATLLDSIFQSVFEKSLTPPLS